MSPCVYVGPSRPFNQPIMRNAILADSPEKVFPALTPIFEKEKSFRKLFVPISELPKVRTALKNPGSPWAIWNEEVSKASDKFKQEAK